MHLDDPNLWRNDPWLRGLEGRLASTPRPFRLVTFDCFDTLVNRLTAEPADLFVEAGRRLAAQGLLRPGFTPEEFHDARIAADDRARKRAVREGRPLELQLAAIYQELTGLVTDPEAAEAVEWEAERAVCYLNPSMASFVRHLRRLGYATALVSDTYFTHDRLERLLLDNGFNPRHFDRIWASCEHGCGKYDSALFRRLLQAHGLHGNEVLHVGDSPVADVRGALGAGIEPVEYAKTLGAHQAVFRAEAHLRQEPRPVAGSLDSVRVLASRLGGCNPRDGHFEGALGFGPLLARFADWAVETYRRAGVTTVLALMREGELLGELLARAASAHQVPLKVVPCYVSRKSTAVASLGEPSVDRMLELLMGGPNLTWQDVLEILGLTGVVQQAAGLTDDLLGQKVESPDALRWLLQSLLQSPALAGAVAQRVHETHGLAFEYLTGLIGDAGTVGILDLGWSGSIQKNIAQILAKGGRPTRFVGCYLATTPRAARVALDGDRIHGFLTQSWNFKSLLLEIAITAPVGSTEGYRRGPDGAVEPLLGPFFATPAELEAKARVREGILAFQDLWLRILAPRDKAGLAGILAEIDRRLYAVAVRMLHYPTQDDATTLGILQHDENYGVLTRQALVDPAAVARFREGGLEGLQRLADCHWPQGVLAQEHPRLMHTLALRWDAATPIGRLGARAGSKGLPLSFGPDEAHYLDQLLAAVDLGQVCLVGKGAQGDPLWLNTWLEARFGPEPAEGDDWPREYPLVPPGEPAEAGLEPPRALYLDAEAPLGPALELVPRLARTGLKLATCDRTPRLRRLLNLDQPVLLLLGAGLEEGLALELLRGFTPFLAPGSLVGICHGPADPSQAFGADAGLGVFKAWLASGGVQDGFEAVTDLMGDTAFPTALALAMRNPPTA